MVATPRGLQRHEVTYSHSSLDSEAAKTSSFPGWPCCVQGASKRLAQAQQTGRWVRVGTEHPHLCPQPLQTAPPSASIRASSCLHRLFPLQCPRLPLLLSLPPRDPFPGPPWPRPSPAAWSARSGRRGSSTGTGPLPAGGGAAPARTAGFAMATWWISSPKCASSASKSAGYGAKVCVGHCGEARLFGMAFHCLDKTLRVPLTPSFFSCFCQPFSNPLISLQRTIAPSLGSCESTRRLLSGNL